MSHTDRPPEADGPTRWQVAGNWVVFVAALLVFALGIYLLLNIVIGGPAPVAAAFTRVGGATDVGTAVDASRFWLTPPKQVVETKANATQAVMLGAARCATVNHAPLLFISPDGKPPPLVQATTNSWWNKAADKDHTIMILDKPEAESCLEANNARKRPVKVTGLSVLKVRSQERQLRGLQLPPRPMLAPFVVFAAPIAPGAPPDVAVGLALAAHLATADGERVSLVVIQPYLEADPALEDQLRNQREVVTGGLVLGQTPTVPEDTRALLRRLLTSTDRQGWANQLQADLGSVAPLIAALFALAGFGAVAQRTPAIQPQVSQFGHWVHDRTRSPPKGARQRIQSIVERVVMRKNGSISAVLADLKSDENVTVWLYSGWKVTGKFVAFDPSKTLHLSQAAVEIRQDSPDEFPNVYVRFQDIQLVGVDDRRSSGAPNQVTPAAAAVPSSAARPVA